MAARPGKLVHHSVCLTGTFNRACLQGQQKLSLEVSRVCGGPCVFLVGVDLTPFFPRFAPRLLVLRFAFSVSAPPPPPHPLAFFRTPPLPHPVCHATLLHRTMSGISGGQSGSSIKRLTAVASEWENAGWQETRRACAGRGKGCHVSILAQYTTMQQPFAASSPPRATVTVKTR